MCRLLSENGSVYFILTPNMKENLIYFSEWFRLKRIHLFLIYVHMSISL